MKPGTSRVLLLITSLAFIILVGAKGVNIVYSRYVRSPVDIEDFTPHTFTISRGESVKSIGERLEKLDLIRSKFIFYIYIRQKNLAERIKAGQFELQKNFSLREIMDMITDAGTGEVAVTIPEGWTISDIDRRLAELKLIQPGAFLECTRVCDFKDFEFVSNVPSLEGFLFPDTYFVEISGFKSENFIRKLLENFKDKLKKVEEQGQASSKYTLKERIIMASILEKEVRTEDDLKIVSGILWKRLENDWQLGADATLLYITGKNTITQQDLEIDSPYNTRKNKGLPPTAISNPGLNSILAAFFPQESQYWFYLTKPESGEVVYAVTNDEHNRNRRAYLE